MSHFDVNWLAIVLAMLASMAIGFGWYMALSRQWLAASGRTPDDIDARNMTPFIWSAACQLVTAYFIARLTPTIMGDTGVMQGIIVAIHMWIGFVATTIIINHRYQGRPWSLTAIDGGYLLFALIAQGVVIGLFGG